MKDLTGYQNPNDWVRNAKKVIAREIFFNEEAAAEAFISYGWPSIKGVSKTQRRLGEAWSGCVGEDEETGATAIFISPTQFYPENYVFIVHLIAHEMIHIILGPGKGHGKEFRDWMEKIDLVGNPKATEPGEFFEAQAEKLRSQIGGVPEARLEATVVKTQSTRLLKIVCKCDEPGIIRLSRKQLDRAPILCGNCKKEFEEEEVKP